MPGWGPMVVAILITWRDTTVLLYLGVAIGLVAGECCVAQRLVERHVCTDWNPICVMCSLLYLLCGGLWTCHPRLLHRCTIVQEPVLHGTAHMAMITHGQHQMTPRDRALLRSGTCWKTVDAATLPLFVRWGHTCQWVVGGARLTDHPCSKPARLFRRCLVCRCTAESIYWYSLAPQHTQAVACCVDSSARAADSTAPGIVTDVYPRARRKSKREWEHSITVLMEVL